MNRELYMKKYTIDINQLKYVKCVNAETPYSLAYCDYQLHAEFNLKFPNNNALPENAEKLKKK